MGNQEKLDYIAGPDFKSHIFEGTSKPERTAQESFLNRIANRILDTPVVRGEEKDKKVTSLRDTLRWLGSTFDAVYSLIVTVRGEVAALREEVKQLAAIQGGQIDYTKVEDAVEKAVLNLADSVERSSTTINLKDQEEAPK